MAHPLTSVDTSIYIYDTKYHEKGLYAVHPVNTEENVARLKEFGVDLARVHVITDNTYLQRELVLRNKATLILGGGYTYFLSKELQYSYSVISASVHSGLLNVWGQCSGGNILCESISVPGKNYNRNPSEIKHLKLLPLAADASVYPLEKDKTLGDVVNRKVISLASPGNETFNTYWYRGSQYKYSQDFSSYDIAELSPLAYYTDLDERLKLYNKPIAAICGTNLAGAKVIASGNHSEISKWRQAQAEALTRAVRPDLWALYEKRSFPFEK